jgi:hypothetical protein
MDAIQDGHAVNSDRSKVCTPANAIRKAQKAKAGSIEGLTGLSLPALLPSRFLFS